MAAPSGSVGLYAPRMEFSRSARALVIGLLLAAVGGFLADSGGGLGYVVLAIASVFATIGMIGIGVRLGLADYHQPNRPAVKSSGRPWKQD